MMAVHTSNMEPLLHQITAVYESMLPRQPLRFLLADDPGAGKIVRLDQLSRNEEMQEKLCAAGWDLAVFDEAHKLAAHYFGSELEKTARFPLRGAGRRHHNATGGQSRAGSSGDIAFRMRHRAVFLYGFAKPFKFELPDVLSGTSRGRHARTSLHQSLLCRGEFRLGGG
jgi:hypothetical protein